VLGGKRRRALIDDLPHAGEQVFDLALAAVRRGKHVVCEKPLTTSTADATVLANAAAEAGVTATVPFVYRSHPMVREARARVLAGEAGRLLTIQGSYLQDWLLESTDDNWRVDETLGGPSRAFADIGSHLCDLIEFVTGDRIARLQAVTRTVFGQRSAKAVATEDLAAVLFETRDGVVGTLLVSQLAPGRKNRLYIELCGTDETIERERREQPVRDDRDQGVGVYLGYQGCAADRAGQDLRGRLARTGSALSSKEACRPA